MFSFAWGTRGQIGIWASICVKSGRPIARGVRGEGWRVLAKLKSNLGSNDRCYHRENMGEEWTIIMETCAIVTLIGYTPAGANSSLIPPTSYSELDYYLKTMNALLIISVYFKE